MQCYLTMFRDIVIASLAETRICSINTPAPLPESCRGTWTRRSQPCSGPPCRHQQGGEREEREGGSWLDMRVSHSDSWQRLSCSLSTPEVSSCAVVPHTASDLRNNYSHSNRAHRYSMYVYTVSKLARLSNHKVGFPQFDQSLLCRFANQQRFATKFACQVDVTYWLRLKLRAVARITQ